MEGRSHWASNPFVLGLLGIGLMVGGYVMMRYRPPAEADVRARFRAAAERLEGQPGEEERRAAEALRREGTVAPALPLLLPGRLTFWAGLVVVVFAAVQWYRQAQQPPSPADDAAAAEEPVEE